MRFTTWRVKLEAVVTVIVRHLDTACHVWVFAYDHGLLVGVLIVLNFHAHYLAILYDIVNGPVLRFMASCVFFGHSVVVLQLLLLILVDRVRIPDGL